MLHIQNAMQTIENTATDRSHQWRYACKCMQTFFEEEEEKEAESFFTALQRYLLHTGIVDDFHFWALLMVSPFDRINSSHSINTSSVYLWVPVCMCAYVWVYLCLCACACICVYMRRRMCMYAFVYVQACV